ncbi:hypothetical protein K2173_026496 [Erythroxylum novogranatense]|uniref:Uncharacterized protein n=1 Tax=Erythroxylum novogranatense TaxID=1862640 RepID=A0AAV8TZ38_9ROSI|nr:hypothetical protein K2173_026496 [Erythroxylum novogranatense]
MSSRENSVQKHGGVGVQAQISDSLIMHNTAAHDTLGKLNGNENNKYFQDRAAMEFDSQVKAQKEEIQFLRKQIAAACVREVQSLNEKFVLERKFSELRMAKDEKHHEAITSSLEELARRKGDLEENLKLANDLKVVHEETCIFMSSMLGLLSEYGVLPRVISTSSILSNIKQLHDELQWKVRILHSQHMTFPTNAIRDERHLDSKHNVPRYMPDSHLGQKSILIPHTEMPQQLSNSSMQEFSFNPDGWKVPDLTSNRFIGKGISNAKAGEVNMDVLHQSNVNDEIASVSEEGPGIEGFQIIGDATPGEKLLGCGYPVRGTSLCIFQWVRHLEDGTTQYIEGATNPEYTVTADDVDKLIAVECIPMDEQGRQGDLVRLYANDQNKIRCDPNMQREIETYIAKEEATFNILLLTDYPDNWKPTTLILQRSGYQIKNSSEEILIKSEIFSKNLSIKIPSGLSAQFLLSCSDGSSHPLSAYTVRMRDTVVLTMRMFQSKALDERRKDKA